MNMTAELFQIKKGNRVVVEVWAKSLLCGPPHIPREPYFALRTQKQVVYFEGFPGNISTEEQWEVSNKLLVEG